MSSKEEKIKYLSSYRWYEKDLERDREKLEALESRLYSPVAASLSGMPKSGKAFELEPLLLEKEQLQKQIRLKLKRMSDISFAIESLEDPRYRLLLKLLYIDGYTQSAAAEIMNYCNKTILRLAKAAVEVFEIPDEYTIPPEATA